MIHRPDIQGINTRLVTEYSHKLQTTDDIVDLLDYVVELESLLHDQGLLFEKVDIKVEEA